ncbi:MAG: GNAT family N-acetyltransferase [Caulobacteraceae bacterium]
MLSGNKVRLRAVEKEDIPKLVKIRNDEGTLTNLFSRLPHPVSVHAEELSYVEKCKKKYPDEVDLLIEKLDGTIIGKCGTKQTRWKDSETTVHIFIGGDENRGKGYGTEAMKLLIRFIFEQMNIRRIRLNVFSFNERAVKSYEKLGFKVEAVSREAVFRYGCYYDLYEMGILRDEYLELRKT